MISVHYFDTRCVDYDVVYVQPPFAKHPTRVETPDLQAGNTDLVAVVGCLLHILQLPIAIGIHRKL